MLGSVIGTIASLFTAPFINRVADVIESYKKGEITKAELDTRLKEHTQATFRDIEVVHAETLAKTYDSFMQAVKSTPTIARFYLIAGFSQLFVLFWYQWVVPFGAYMGFWTNYPSPGATVDWAYLLIGVLIGAGPLVLRAGPGAANTVAQLLKLKR